MVVATCACFGNFVLDLVVVLFQCGVFSNTYCFTVGSREARWVYLQNAFVNAEETVSRGLERSCEGRLEVSTFPLAAFIKYG